VLKLNFGHWEIFKMLVMSLREGENNAKTPVVTFKNDQKDISDGPSSSMQQAPAHGRLKQKSVIEKQVIKTNQSQSNPNFHIKLSN
jgi:hypothetical protein